MASLDTMEQLEVAHTEIREVIETIKTKIENVLNVDNFSINAKGESELIEQTIGDLAKLAANQLAGLKTRRNALEPINRLPVEILTYIILITNTWMEEVSHPYIRYTWVCHRWRSVLIQNPAFWTVIQHRFCHHDHGSQSAEPIYEELLRRAKSAKLDVRLSQHSVPFTSTLKKLFAEESDRICRLKFNDDEAILQLVLSGKQFPSLQRLAAVEDCGHHQGKPFLSVAPVFFASDHLETLHCSLGNGGVPFDQLAPIFTRIRNLSLFIHWPPVDVPPLLEILHNSAKLQTLQLHNKHFQSHINARPAHQIVLPELQLLWAGSNCFPMLERFRAPKLSNLNAVWSTNPVALAFEEFAFQSIRHLYIRCFHNNQEQCNHRLCVLAGKESVGCNSLFSTKCDIFYEDPSTYARNFFHLGFDHNTFAMVLQGISGILPRLTSLVELYFLVSHSQDEFETLVSHLPSVEKLVIQHGNKLLNVIHFLNKSPLPCPKLKYLSLKTFAVPKGLRKYANDVGRSLTRYLQARRKESADPLEHIILENCPPLPDNWLEKIRDLGTDVVTEKDAENIQVMSKRRKVVQCEHNHRFSDVEL